MALITNAILDLLLRTKRICSLCFSAVQKESVSIHDSVFLDLNNSEEVIDMLSYVLGHQFTENMKIHDSVCGECFKATKTSYIFIKKCKENFEFMNNMVDSLDECFEDTNICLDQFNSLFVSVDTNDFSYKQYYDSKDLQGKTKMALARYRVLAKSKYGRGRRSPTNSPRTRNHKYSEETLKICNVIRENNRSTYQCKVCKMVFSKSFNFKKHYFSQHSEKQFQCPYCERSYGSKALLKQHNYDSHAMIICSECGKCYKNRYSLLYHMRTHSGQKPYECKHCGKKFHWASRRAEHIRRMHLDPNVTCNICQIKFRTLSSLYMHRKRHFDPNSKYFLQQTPPVAIEEVCQNEKTETTV